MTATTTASPRRSWLRPGRIATAVTVVLFVFVAVSEWAGWPFLAGPVQTGLGSVLDRRVRLFEHADPDAQGSTKLEPVAAGTHRADGVEIHLLGGIDIAAARIEIGAPSWNTGAPTLMASNGRIKLRYVDLWRAYRGEQVVVRSIAADRLELAFERDAEGRATWQFGKKKPQQDDRDARLPVIEELLVRSGRLELKDAQLDSTVNARFSLVERAGRPDERPGAKTAAPVGATQKNQAADPPIGLQIQADGRYRALPFRLEASSSGALGWVDDGTMPIKIRGSVGHAQLRFDGSLRDVPTLSALNGTFFLSGRSLAAVGDVIGVTLPTTPAFTVRGALTKRNDVWSTRVDDARIGDSRLTAALRYDAAAKPRLLEGRVGGSRLLLQDLGPAIGTTPADDVANPARKVATRPAGRVLPAREFDLPSLRAMNANILLAFDELDLGTGRLEPLAPMRAHLVLRDAVLTIQDIEARAASGSLTGMLSLDGRKQVAIWQSDLRWQNIRLEKWLNIERKNGAPPYISGRLDGRSKLDGQGKSTAQILASLNGTMRARVRDGTVSHLLVEGAGIDLAQALGVWIKGDEPLPMSCALTELRVANGVMKPEVMVIDTRDSIIWVDGSISLVDESLDLKAVTSPKDFSPLSLRTPVLVGGTMASPSVSLSSKPLAGKVIAAGLLSLLNPLAALIPLIDTGAADDTASGCAELVSKAAQRKRAAKP